MFAVEVLDETPLAEPIQVFVHNPTCLIQHLFPPFTILELEKDFPGDKLDEKIEKIEALNNMLELSGLHGLIKFSNFLNMPNMLLKPLTKRASMKHKVMKACHHITW